RGSRPGRRDRRVGRSAAGSPLRTSANGQGNGCRWHAVFPESRPPQGLQRFRRPATIARPAFRTPRGIAMHTASALARAVFVICPFLTGCGAAGSIVITTAPTKQATEERNLIAAHVAGSGLDVRSDFGAVDIAADPALSEVKVTAKVTAFGE